MSDLVIRHYGNNRPGPVIALHGGPAAAGDVAPLARELEKKWHVLEPFQRGSGRRPLTVATHVRDLDALIAGECGGRSPVLVGHSWGAMLALAYAAEHPATPAALALVGCGTFTEAARAEFEARLDARLTPGDRAIMARIERTEPDPNRRLAALGRLMTRVYGCDLDESADDGAPLDGVAHEETWADMLRLQREGTYPAAFAAINVPVLMVHGDADPHPGRLISQDLRAHIPHLEYVELAHCGHSPWLERQARTAFFAALETWLEAQSRSLWHPGPLQSRFLG